LKRLHGSYGVANPSLEAEKAELRARMRKVRKQLAAEYLDAAIHASLGRSAGVPPALPKEAGETPALQRRVIANYHPQGSELDPGPLIDALVADGWQAALPRAQDRESALTFHAAGGPFAPDAFGIPAPLATAPRLTPDLLIVPVLAFDRFGGRLGQGAGCYDRTIAALRAAGPVRVIGLAYTGQEVDRVPTGEHDQPLDGILTDKGWVEVVRPPA
jgi:5-formyltetrahydrofolate cyclo-ligase